MSKPSNFITSSDYPTLKNGGSVEATVTIPAAAIIPGNGSLSYYSDVTIPIANAVLSARIKSSLDGDRWYGGQQMFQTRGGLSGGSGIQYIYVAFVYRISPTTVRCQIHIPNPFNVNTTCYNGEDIVSFRISTFVPPFA